MKFEYTHNFEIDRMIKVQTELCNLLYSRKTKLMSLLLILFGAFVSIFGVSISLGLLAGLLGAGRYDGVGNIIGIFMGAMIYLKVILPRINGYFYKRQKVSLGETYISNYIFKKTGIQVKEEGRVTSIEWSAISSLEETKGYIGLLCRGLFYYLPRETIGDGADQNKFILQCKQWMEEAKK